MCPLLLKNVMGVLYVPNCSDPPLNLMVDFTAGKTDLILLAVESSNAECERKGLGVP